MTSPCEDNPFESLGLIHPHKFEWAPMKGPIQMYAPTNIESSLSQKYPQHLLGPQPKQVTAGFFGLDKKKICQLHDVSLNGTIKVWAAPLCELSAIFLILFLNFFF